MQPNRQYRAGWADDLKEEEPAGKSKWQSKGMMDGRNLNGDHVYVDKASGDPVCMFEFSALDSPMDNIKELIASGIPPDEAYAIIADFKERLVVQEAVNQVLSVILDSRTPGIVADAVAWVSRLHVVSGQTIPSLARKHGISKQAFRQAVGRVEAKIGPYISPSSRTDQARDNMRKSYFQKPKYD